jgi:hypothetical protein
VPVAHPRQSIPYSPAQYRDPCHRHYRLHGSDRLPDLGIAAPAHGRLLRYRLADLQQQAGAKLKQWQGRKSSRITCLLVYKLPAEGDAPRIAWGCRDGVVKVADGNELKNPVALPLGGEGRVGVTCLAHYTEPGEGRVRLVAGFEDMRVEVLDGDHAPFERRHTFTLAVPAGTGVKITALAAIASVTGRPRVVVGTSGGAVWVLDPEAGEVTHDLRELAQGDAVTALAAFTSSVDPFHPCFVTGSKDRSVVSDTTHATHSHVRQPVTWRVGLTAGDGHPGGVGRRDGCAGAHAGGPHGAGASRGGLQGPRPRPRPHRHHRTGRHPGKPQEAPPNTWTWQGPPPPGPWPWPSQGGGGPSVVGKSTTDVRCGDCAPPNHPSMVKHSVQHRHSVWWRVGVCQVWDARSGELLRSLPTELYAGDQFPVVPYPTVTGPVRLVAPRARPGGGWDINSSVKVSLQGPPSWRGRVSC